MSRREEPRLILSEQQCVRFVHLLSFERDPGFLYGAGIFSIYRKFTGGTVAEQKAV